MTAWLTRATAATAVAALLASGGAVSAVAAPADGSNWPHPTAAGLLDCTFTGPFKDESGHGVFDGQDVPRRRWNCSSFEITFAVFRYPSTAEAQAAEASAGQWHRNYTNLHDCGRGDDPGGCGTVRNLNGGQVFSADDSINYGVYTGVPQVTNQESWNWLMGAWTRTGNYVVFVEQTSPHYAGGYFSAAELVAAAKHVSSNPPTGLGYAPRPLSGSSDAAPPSGGGTKAKKLAKARDAADATRLWARKTNKRYNKLKTPRRETLIALGASQSAAKKSRFAGFKPRPAKRVWIKYGNVCISAKGTSSGTWRSTTCPMNVRWAAPK